MAQLRIHLGSSPISSMGLILESRLPRDVSDMAMCINVVFLELQPRVKQGRRVPPSSIMSSCVVSSCLYSILHSVAPEQSPCWDKMQIRDMWSPKTQRRPSAWVAVKRETRTPETTAHFPACASLPDAQSFPGRNTSGSDV